MSLFEWSTPERRKVDQILPIIPNEIYLHIFDIIAPPGTEELKSKGLEIFVNLSCVCRLFANVCLPRIYEFVEFSGLGPASGPSYMALRGSTLFAHIAAQQPLALALVRTVRLCRFTYSSNISECEKFIAAMSHMNNIRVIQFSYCWIMEAEHWRAIAALPSLEDLAFHSCSFRRFSTDAEPEQNFKLKISALSMVNCLRLWCPIAVVDIAHLRVFRTDYSSVSKGEDWLRHSAVTKLQVDISEEIISEDASYTPGLNMILSKAPRSLEVLCFSVAASETPKIARDILQSMLDAPSAWTILFSLRSLILRVADERSIIDASGSMIANSRKIPPFLLDKLGPAPSLKHMDYFGTVFRLVDGEWAQVSFGWKLYELPALAFI